MFQESGRAAHSGLHKFIHFIWSKEELPQQWMVSISVNGRVLEQQRSGRNLAAVVPHLPFTHMQFLTSTYNRTNICQNTNPSIIFAHSLYPPYEEEEYETTHPFDFKASSSISPIFDLLIT
jgi:hypothetical protein